MKAPTLRLLKGNVGNKCFLLEDSKWFVNQNEILTSKEFIKGTGLKLLPSLSNCKIGKGGSGCM